MPRSLPAPRSRSSPWECPTTSPSPSRRAAAASASALRFSANDRSRPPRPTTPTTNDHRHLNSRYSRRLYPPGPCSSWSEAQRHHRQPRRCAEDIAHCAAHGRPRQRPADRLPGRTTARPALPNRPAYRGGQPQQDPAHRRKKRGRDSGRALNPLLIHPAASYGLKTAPTVSLLFIWTWQAMGLVGTAVHLDDHPPKTDPDAGVAVSVTTVPRVNVPLQVAPAAGDPQAMVPGELVTVPVPV